MPEHHLNKRVSKLEEKVSKLEHPRQHDPHSASPHNHAKEHVEATPGQTSRADTGSDNSTQETNQGNSNRRPWWIRMWIWKPWKRSQDYR